MRIHFLRANYDDGTVGIQAWEKALAIPREERQTAGALYEVEGQVVLNFKQVPNGCRSKEDGDVFLVRPTRATPSAAAIEDQGLHARKRGKENVVGIRLVPRGGTLRNHSGAEVVLPKWAVVVLIRVQSGRNYVRYVDPDMGSATEGWTSSNLTDPFLKSK